MFICDDCGEKNNYEIIRKFHPMGYEAGNDVSVKCKKCGHEEWIYYE